VELLTASRMAAMLGCPRRHYWRYECGLRREESGDALRFGSAWHRAMEHISLGFPAEAAYAAAVPQTGADLDEVAAATLCGLLRAYAAHWQGSPLTVDHAEVEFETVIDGSRTFRAAGKIDGLGRVGDRCVLVEHKTTSAALDSDSDYWLRLRADSQILQYASAARAQGWPVAAVWYDVARKPSIRPKEIGKGIDRHQETPEEYGERVYADATARPEWYFARREVPVVDDDLEEFAENRLQVARMILDRRAQQRKRPEVPHRAWPRHVNGMACPYCEFAGFCLANVTPDLAHPPAGYVIGPQHAELSNQGGQQA
jgi:hypothetical protein